MDPLENIALPPTAEGKLTRAYILAQANSDFSEAAQFFTEDIVFNDVMFPVTGRDAVVASLTDYVKNYLTSIRVEAVSGAGPEHIMVLNWISLRGAEEQAVCDLLTFRDGKICRVDNCFDAKKLP